MGYKIFDKGGTQIGHSVEDNDGCIVVILFGAGLFSVVWCFAWVVDTLKSWESHSVPYNYVSMYYYRMIESPISFISFIANWSKNLQLTIYPNINGIIGFVIPSSLVLSFIFLIWLLFRQENSVFIYIKRTILVCLFLPIIGILFWFLIETAFHWLTIIE